MVNVSPSECLECRNFNVPFSFYLFWKGGGRGRGG